MVTSYPDQRTSTSGAILLLAISAAAIIAALLFAAPLFHTQRIDVEWQSHAENGDHAADAASVRHCLDNRGPYQVWRDRANQNKFYLLCQIDDGRWGFSAVVKEGGRLIEKTSFVKGAGTWQELTNYLRQFATRFSGSIPGV